MLAVSLFTVSCDNRRMSTSDHKMQRQTEESMQEANRQIGMPAITRFQERKLAKLIFEQRDREDLVCYAYIVSLQGELIFIGKCVGYGLPYSVQYTNPVKVVDGYDQVRGEDRGGVGAPLAVPQVDPNGLFMPEGLSATWLMMIEPDSGKPRPVYVEPEIMVSPFQLH